MTMIRPLIPSDRNQLDGYLRSHADTSLLMLGNLERAGMQDRGKPYEGTYVGAFDGARLIGCLALFWNGNVLIQTDQAIADLLQAAIGASGRPVGGVLGPLGQVEACLAALRPHAGLPQSAAQQSLMALIVDEMKIPEPLSQGSIACRRAVAADLELVTQWRLAHLQEQRAAALPVLQAMAEEEMSERIESGALWLAIGGNKPVAMAGLLALAAGRGLIGGVWTPHEHRGHGYGRSVVAGMLLALRWQGVARAVLFTGRANAPALAAYRSLGFESIGPYGMAFYARQPSLGTTLGPTVGSTR
ncbi:MAG: GNAT family N-acetyltransferase [Rhodospirillales bacterium]